MSEPELYVVQNEKGEYFRRKGYGGYGKTWCVEFAKARVYTKIGSARSIVTFFAKNYPEFPAPKLVRLVFRSMEVVDETENVRKRIAAQERAKARRAVNVEKRRLEAAKKRVEEAQREVVRLIEQAGGQA